MVKKLEVRASTLYRMLEASSLRHILSRRHRAFPSIYTKEFVERTRHGAGVKALKAMRHS